MGVYKHGMARTPIWFVHQTMVDRCTRKKSTSYERYGAKGIRVCKRWLDFRNFYADMGDRPSDGHSIERINNAKGYAPKNCRWATRTEQARNRRNNVLFTFHGETKCMTEWCLLYGIHFETVKYRIRKAGMDPFKAFITPVKK